MTLGWSYGPHSITLSDQLIRCWTAGMVALIACSLALLLPLSSGSLVNIIYTPSWRGNCCLAFGGGGPGVGVGDPRFLLFLWPIAMSNHTAESCGWLACRPHCETCMVRLAYHSWCMVAELDPAELGPAVSPQVFASDCLPQPLDPPAAGPLLPVGCHTGHLAAHPSSF